MADVNGDAPAAEAAAPPVQGDYHTHTWRCRHALGTVLDYAEAASARGLRTLGVSDHTPLPDDHWPSIRMSMREFPDYLGEIERAKLAYPDLVLLRAVECDLRAEYLSFYEDELLGRHRLDYLIAAVHFYPCDGAWRGIHAGPIGAGYLRAYADHLIRFMASGLFAFVAHPDVFGCSYLNWDADAVACARDILAAAQELRMPLEINTYGMRKPPLQTPDGTRAPYPLTPFWELAAEYDVAAVVNSDAHTPAEVAMQFEEGLALAKVGDLHVVEITPRYGPR